MPKNKQVKKISKSRKKPTEIHKPNEEKKLNVKSSIKERCKDWLLTQKEIPDKEKLKDYKHSSDSDEDVNSDNELMSILEPNLVKLRKIPKEKKDLITDECEWSQCTFSTQNSDIYYYHLKTHIEECVKVEKDEYKCNWQLCNFKSSNDKTIIRHIFYHGYHMHLKGVCNNLRSLFSFPPCQIDSKKRNIIPELKKDFLCEWDNCEKHFISIQVYLKHIKIHCIVDDKNRKSSTLFSSKPVLICKWYNCQKKFNSLYRLFVHVRTHTNEKRIACSHCGAMLSNNTMYYDHCKRQFGNNTEEYECMQCDKLFASERLLREHVKNHLNTHKCYLCDMSCSKASSLAKHIRYRHINERPYKCSVCNNGFVQKNDLTRHINASHSDKNPFECDEFGCDFSCKTSITLKRHHLKVHGEIDLDNYCCHCCDKRYTQGCRLSQHLIKVHGFQYPAGHTRFNYREDYDGNFRLQTVRIESLEVTKKIISTPSIEKNNVQDKVYTISEVNKADNKLIIELNEIVKDDKHQKETYTKYGDIILPIDDDSQERVLKNIDDFTVMRKYIKNSKKNVIISVDDTDKDGNIVNSKIINAKDILIP